MHHEILSILFHLIYTIYTTSYYHPKNTLYSISTSYNRSLLPLLYANVVIIVRIKKVVRKVSPVLL